MRFLVSEPGIGSSSSGLVRSSISLIALALGLLGCAAPTTPAPLLLEGGRWELAAITSMDDTQPLQKPVDASRYWIEFGANGRMLLKFDCNTGHSTWHAEPSSDSGPARRAGSLKLGAMATTRAACPPDSLEPRLIRLLPYVRSYVIERGHLHLSLMADGGILSWAPASRPASER